jgi:ribosomal protein S12 methylthiotransferase
MASISGDFRIRLLYLYPTAIDDGLLEEIAGEDKIHKYLDIPLQHSEDRILRLMGRRGRRKEYGKLLRQIRRTIPEVALRTTFIVGFPSETEEEFNGLADFIEEMRFDRLGVFKYSREEGTPAAHIRGQIPGKVKDRRLDEIMKRQALVSLEKNRDLVGRRYEAVIDEIDGDLALARLYSHAPEIDGMVIIERSEVRRQEPGGKRPARRSGVRSQELGVTTEVSGEALRVGNIVTVEIVDAYDYDVRGVVIDDGIAQDEDAMSHDKSRIMIRK